METLKIDSTNAEMQLALSMIKKTRNSFFLTGKAGSGKTTFLKAVQKEVNKNFMVLAPTGTSAIQAGGTTIHSALGLSFGVLGPHDFGDISYPKQVAIQHVDTIIIDEVSMVRCDIMDAINRTLCEIRRSRLPFGGIQMVFVGDVFQLPPVRTSEDAKILKDLYPDSNDFYFYNANVFEFMSLPRIELKKVYRQSDAQFISLLDRFRTGQITYNELESLNRTGLMAAYFSKADADRITLTITNRAAERINSSRLNAIDAEQVVFPASYYGDCSKLHGVAEDQLTLKVGAQVMFTRNAADKSYSNGSIGTVTKINETGIYVQHKDREYQLGRETWDSIDYQYNKETRHIEKTIVGSVVQYPLRLAWAITIHKSQGQTFDKVSIDFGDGAFSYGQAYVALSRARTLDGISLVHPIGMNSVRVSDDAISFAKLFNDMGIINNEMFIGAAINDYLSNNDYDGAACKLVELALPTISEGNISLAYTLINRALTFVIDDKSITVDCWTECPGASYEALFLNGVGYYFSGDYHRAMHFLDEIDCVYPRHLNLIFIKAQCCEKLQMKYSMQDAYKRIDSIISESIFNGLDSVAFRKYFFKTAFTSDNGIRNLKALISELPTYIPYHTALRKIIFERCNEQIVEPSDENKLINAFLKQECTDTEFENLLLQEIANNSNELSEYQKFVRKTGDVKDNK